MTFYHIILYFTIYSFIGWLMETIYCSIPQKKFVYRGFLNGPFCPIYGFGAIALLIALSEFKDNILVTFILSVIITSIIEFISSYILEITLHTKLWDYSEKKFNLKGRICLQNSLLFGLAATVFILFAHPALSNLIHYKLSDTVIKYTAIAFLVYFIIDTIVSVYTVLNINNTLSHIHNDLSIIKSKINHSSFDNLKMKFTKRLLYKRMLKAFPNMKPKKHKDSLQKLREYIKNKSV